MHLNDGKTLRADVPLALGNPGNPMSWAGMAARFAGLVEPVPGDGARPLFEALRQFETPGTLARVMKTVERATIWQQAATADIACRLHKKRGGGIPLHPGRMRMASAASRGRRDA